MVGRIDRSGFSLIEVLVALAVIALMTGALMYSTVNTVSQSARAEDLMLEALIAQTIVSEIKDASLQNPHFFANLTTRYQFQEVRPGVHHIFGSVTAKRPEVTTPHGPLVPCNLFTDLPVRVMSQAAASGTELVDNLFTPLGYGQGPDPLSDFALRVTVTNQEIPRDFEGRRYFSGPMGEILKTVTVEIYRVSDLGPAGWKPAYRVSHAMLTPVESLSPEASRELDSRFGSYDHKPVLEKLQNELREVATFESYPPQALELYSLFMLLLREVNVEYCRSEARSIITGKLVGPRDQGLRRRIQRLSEADSGYLKLERGYLMQEKLLLTFDTFKRTIGPLKDLLRIMQEIDTQATQLGQDASNLNQESSGVATAFSRIMNVNGFNELLGRFTALQQQFGQQLQQQKQLLSTIRLMEYLLSRKHMEAAFERLRQYPALFAADLKSTQDHFQTLSQDRTASPLVRAVASREWVAMSIAWRVSAKESDLNSPDQAHLALLKAANQGGFPLLEDHLDQNALPRPLPDLQLLNEGFTGRQTDFRTLAARDGPPREISRTLEPAGSQTGALDKIGTIPGTFYKVVVSAARGARRVGMTPQEATARIGPTVDTLRPVVEETMALGLTTPMVIRSGQPASQLTRIGRLRKDRSWRKPSGAGGASGAPSATVDVDDPLPATDLVIEPDEGETDYDPDEGEGSGSGSGSGPAGPSQASDSDSDSDDGPDLDDSDDTATSDGPRPGLSGTGGTPGLAPGVTASGPMGQSSRP